MKPRLFAFLRAINVGGHTVAMPKKEGFKPDELNERGKWLLSEKDKLKATEVKPEWLKTYPGGK